MNMTIEQLDKAAKAQPFKPFSIHLADGTSLPVMSPERFWRTQGGRLIFVFVHDEAADIVQLSQVTDISFDVADRQEAANLP
jgi:hypothetical protein